MVNIHHPQLFHEAALLTLAKLSIVANFRIVSPALFFVTFYLQTFYDVKATNDSQHRPTDTFVSWMRKGYVQAKTITKWLYAILRNVSFSCLQFSFRIIYICDEINCYVKEYQLFKALWRFSQNVGWICRLKQKFETRAQFSKYRFQREYEFWQRWTLTLFSYG